MGFPLTNLEKMLYPEQDLRKAELIAYYARVAEWMLPHVAGRPLTLLRCPNGLDAPCFFQKHAKPGVPDAIRRIEITEQDGSTGVYLVADDLPGLVAAAQLGALELHTWMARADRLERPDLLVFDIDPDLGLAWELVVEAARELRGRLAALELESFVKTTGGKGLHVVAPVRRRLAWEEHKAFARSLVEAMERERPARYTTNARKAQRTGRLFLDYLRNGRGATAVVPYSPRARTGAPVATPITWDELEAGIDPVAFTVRTVSERLAGLRRDPWAAFTKLDQPIRAAAIRMVHGSAGGRVSRARSAG